MLGLSFVLQFWLMVKNPVAQQSQNLNPTRWMRRRRVLLLKRLKQVFFFICFVGFRERERERDANALIYDCIHLRKLHSR